MSRKILHLAGHCTGGVRRHLSAILDGLPKKRYIQATAPTSWLAFRQSLFEFHPDIVHLHGGRASLVGRLSCLFGTPKVASGRLAPDLIYSVHGLPGPGLPAGAIVQVGIEKLLRPLPNVYLAVSQCLADHVTARWGAPSDRVRVVYHGLDESLFEVGRRRVHAPVPRELADQEPVIAGVLARLAREKGVDLAIRAFARNVQRFPGSRLQIAGDGPCRPALESLVGSMGMTSKVTFLGQVADPSVFLAGVDVLLSPSRSEGFGIAAAEAQAAGVPVVAFRTGGLSETVVDGRTGRLVPGEREDLMAVALEDLLSDPDRRARMGLEAHLRAAKLFTRQKMLDEIGMIYDLAGR